MRRYEDEEIINVGVGEDVSITDVAELVKRIIGFTGIIRYDSSKPEGAPRKLLDVTRINGMGWKAGISPEDGIRRTYAWFLDHISSIRR